jgi:hypothetical protein
MTRSRKLREVLNVRLDAPLAGEIARISATWNTSESDAARTLLGYGIEVVRRMQAAEFQRPFSWQEEWDPESSWPSMMEIEVKHRPMTEEEIDRHGLRELVGSPEDWDREEIEP